MVSRYDFMEDGSVIDSGSGNYYPDPLSLNYRKMVLPQVMANVPLDDTDIIYLWELISRYYGSSELDDIVLTINNVPHINLLHSGESLIIPTPESITDAYSKETII